MKKAYNAIEGDSGTIKVIESTTTSTTLPTFESGKEITLDLNGKTLTYYQTLKNNGVLNIIDSTADKNGVLANASTSDANISNTGTINIISGTVTDVYETIYNNSGGTVNITGGEVKAAGNNYITIGIYNNNGKVNITGGKLTVNSTYTGGTSGTCVYGIYNGNNNNKVKVENTEINITSAKTGAYFIYSYSAKEAELLINNGTINVTGTNSSAYFSYYGKNTINGGNITVVSQTAGAVGLYYGTNTVTGGKITVTGVSTSYGAGYGTNIISGGEIEAKHTNNATYYYGYGINQGTNTITGGKISGDTYGIYQGTNTLGIDDEEINATSPEIIGQTYGIYHTTGNGTVTIFDGILKGKTDAYNEGAINRIASNTVINLDTEEIDDETYYRAYLIEERDVAQVGDDTYTNITDAIDEVDNDETIVLINDVVNYDSITVPSGKTVNIDLNGQDLKMTLPITNNGTLNIYDSTNTPGKISYTGSGYLITNNANSNLILNNIILTAPYVIDNKENGTLNTTNTTITSTKVSINNLGTYTGSGDTITSNENAINASNKTLLNGSNITGNKYGIYINTDKEIKIENSSISSDSTSIYLKTINTIVFNNDIIKGYIYNYQNASMIFNDSQISHTNRTDGSGKTIDNNGNITLSNTTISLYTTYQGGYQYSSDYNKVIYNKGTAIIKNNSSVVWNFDVRVKGTCIYNDGTLEIEDSNIQSINDYNNSSDIYGLYNNGNIVFKSGSLNIQNNKVYGIYINTGTVTLGNPEPTTSVNYGKDTADVSTTSPLIESLGTTSGYGVKNNTGTFKYYDGKIIASTKPLPEIPNEVEYLYEPIEYTDLETGNKFVILEWMRNQP